MRELKIYSNLKEIPQTAWTSLIGKDFPFNEYQYLLGMEEGKCVGAKAGWVPFYLTLWEGKTLLGALYLYLKNNSYGEYIFDWSWVNAYARYGLDYFPKMVSAVPFTPATGKKILIHPEIQNEERKEIADFLLQQALKLTEELKCSSLHFLFIHSKEIEDFDRMKFMIRSSYQFHWKNRNYQGFDNFLSALKGKRRKEILRERRKVQEQPVEIEILTGDQLTLEHSRTMYQFYLSTIHKMGAIDYLSSQFFDDMFQKMRDQIVLILAKSAGEWVAGAINYRKGKGLYGRYWGCIEEFKNLHFELCYYQTIEYAIEHQIELFEAGAQGEHKIQRGFLPELTYSAHWIQEPSFRDAIGNFIQEENLSIIESIKNSQKHMPYRNEEKV